MEDGKNKTSVKHVGKLKLFGKCEDKFLNIYKKLH